MSRPLNFAVRLAFVTTLFAALAPCSYAEEVTSADPTVTKGREANDPYGPLPPPELAGAANDDPHARNEWFLRQRTYPFGVIPDNAYDDAAREYLRRRELTRELNLQSFAGGPGPLGPLPTSPWAEVGPAPINPSGFAFGNVAGRVSAVAVHPTNGGTLLVGASRGGIWRTTNSGTSWTPVGDNQNTLVIADIEFAPSNPLIVYAATGDDDINFWGAGVLKSTDGGVTWARIDNGTAANGIQNGTILSKIVVDPTNANVVTTVGYFQAAPSGANFYSFVFHTTDGGVTWSKATIPSGANQAQFRSLVIERNCPTNLWALNFRDLTINRSVDSGVTWTATASVGLPAFIGNTQLAVQHASCVGSATVYANVYSKDAVVPPDPISDNLAGTTNYPAFFRSTDNGATFARPGAAGPSGGCLAQCWYDHFLLVDPSDATRVYMIGRDLWTSTDSGATWINRSAGFDNSNNYLVGNMHVDMHDMAIRGTGATAVIYIASDGGLWSYDVTANTFTNRVGNLAISEFIDLALDPDTPNRAIGGLQDNGSIAYTGALAWPSRLTGDGGPGGYLRVTPGPGNPFDGAFTTYVGNVGYLSTNSGTSFSNWASNGSFSNETSEFYGPWIPTLGNNRVWHAAQRLWYCDFPNVCAPWSTFSATNIAAMTASSYVSKLAINNPTSGVFGPFYAANAYPRAFLQSDDGVTWHDRTGVLPERYISKIQFDPAAPAKVWATLQGFGTGHVWYSADGGTSWADKSGNLPNVPVNTMLLDPEDRANVWYVGTDTGVYGTINGSAVSPTWTVVGTGLPVVMVSDLELDQNRVLYAATGGRSVWRIPVLSSCATVGNNGPICAGGTLNLTASAVAGATYAWTGPNGFSASTQNGSVANASVAATGIYSLTTTLSSTTCVSTTTATVNAVPSPPVATNDGPVCQGTTLNLAATLVPGATYAWTGPNGFFSNSPTPSLLNPQVNASGVYSVTMTVAGCTSTPATTTVTVLPLACNDGNACTAGDACGIAPPNPVQSFDGVTAPALPAGWVSTSTDAPWTTTAAFSVSAPNSATTDTPPYISDKTLDTPPFLQGAGAVLEFDHRYNLEPTFDGAVLEIKIGAGSFTDILTAGGSFVTAGYNAVIPGLYGSPISGRPAWSGGSLFGHTVVNLPAAAVGQVVVLRFRVASDDSVAPAPPNGQWIDNVQVTYGAGCVPGPPLNCDDVNPCTTDSCDPGSGCFHTASDSLRFASAVVAFSSEYTPTIWSAQQALGPPNVYPLYGDNHLAWSSLDPDTPGEFLDLAFDNPAPISFVSVYETYSPGSVSSVSVKNPNTTLFELVWSGAAAPQPPVSRIFTVTFPLTPFPVSEIRVDFDSPAVPDWSEVDAVAIGAGNACEDGNGCTSGDTCYNGVCQPGAPIPVPTETSSLLFAADKSTMSWTPVIGATQYDALAGVIGSLPVGPGGGDEQCAPLLPVPSIATSAPSPGVQWWFLSRARNSCGAGTYGTQGVHGAPGAPRVTATCP